MTDKICTGCLRPYAGNDVRVGAIAELRYGALHGADPAVYVNDGTGISAAIAIGGVVLNGAHGAAGEIAYLRTDNSLDARAATRRPVRERGQRQGDR